MFCKKTNKIGIVIVIQCVCNLLDIHLGMGQKAFAFQYDAVFYNIIGCFFTDQAYFFTEIFWCNAEQVCIIGNGMERLKMLFDQLAEFS